VHSFGHGDGVDVKHFLNSFHMHCFFMPLPISKA
jgi:hypothetical protein